MGIIILSVVLRGVGVPLEGVALILGVDRILEMYRTAVNVTGDLSASVVMNRIVRDQKPVEVELEREAALDAVRAREGTDVVTNHGTDNERAA